MKNGVFSLVLLVAGVPCHAEPAYFWLSASSTSPGGPAAPFVDVANGSNGEIHIWARPDAGRKLRNVSLNLIATQPTIDFLDSSIVVHNSIDGTAQRFEHVSDASADPPLHSTRSRSQVAAGQPDSIRGLQGFTLAPDPLVRGVGATCVANENNCFIAGDGKPAWLIASVSFATIGTSTTTALHLQIGERGMNHEMVVPGDYDFNGVVEAADCERWKEGYRSEASAWADGNEDGLVDAADYTVWRNHLGNFGIIESSSLTSVVFGVDAVGGNSEPVYNAATDRQITLPGDDPDMTIAILPAGNGGLSAAHGVPEPSSLAASVAGALALAFWRRRPRIAAPAPGKSGIEFESRH